MENIPETKLNIAGLVTLLIGFTALFGWWTDHNTLLQFIPQIHDMTFNTALCFVFTGSILLLNKSSQITQISGIILAVFSFLIVSQDLTGFSFGIDTFFFNYDGGWYEGKTYPGRLAPSTAIGFIVTGVFLFLFHGWDSAEFAPLHLGGIATLFLLGAVGVLMRLLLPESTDHFASMSLFTSVGFLSISRGAWKFYVQKYKSLPQQNIFLPAMFLMNRCKYYQKFLIITLLFSIPISALTYNYTTESYTRIESIKQRLIGLEYFQHLFHIFEKIPQHRGMKNAYLSGELSFKSQIVFTNKEVFKHMEEVNQLHQKVQRIFPIDPEWSNIQKQWVFISSHTMTPEESWKKHTLLIQDLMLLMWKLGHYTGLMKDPEWMNIYLIGALLEHLPPLLENIGQARGLGSGVIAKKHISEQEHFELITLSGKTLSALQDLKRVFDMMPLNEKNLWKELTSSPSSITILDESIQNFIEILNNQVLNAEELVIRSDEFFTLGTQTLDHGFLFFLKTLDLSHKALEQHRRVISTRVYLFIFMLLFSLFVVFYLLNGFYLSVAHTVSVLEHNAHCMAEGNMQESLNLEAKDELSRIITAFNKIGTALLQSTEHINAIVNNAVDGIITINTQGEIQSFSPAAESIFGYTELEAQGQNVVMLMPEEFREAHRSGLKRRVEQEKHESFTSTFEVKGLRKEGSLFPLELSLTEMHVGDNYLFLGIVRDITQRKQAEAQLTLLSEVIEQTDETILITDLQGDMVFVNHAFELLTGYSKKEALGKNPRILKSEKQDHAFYAAFWDTLSKGNIWKGALMNRRKDGSFYDTENTVVPIRNRDGELVNYVGIQRNITEKLALQKQMEKMERLESLGALAGGIAHDFNNLLAVMMGHAEVVKMTTHPKRPQYNSLQRIEDAGKRAAELCKQMLAYAGKGQFENHLIDLSHFINENMGALKTAIADSDNLKLKLDHQLPKIKGDRSQIQQTLISLLSNASEALENQAGTIMIQSKMFYADQEYLDTHNRCDPVPEGWFVVLEVSDTGCGMDEETQEKIFDPFFTTKFTGRGLGMSAVLGIVRGHSGALVLNSLHNAGSSFQILFPVPEEELKAIEESKVSLET